METVRSETTYAPVDKNVANGKPHRCMTMTLETEKQ